MLISAPPISQQTSQLPKPQTVTITPFYRFATDHNALKSVKVRGYRHLSACESVCFTYVLNVSLIIFPQSKDDSTFNIEYTNYNPALLCD